MPTETLHFENARVAQQLYNNDSKNLKHLEDQLAVKVSGREGSLTLEGTADAIERAKHLFLQLEGLLKAGTPIRSREFNHALQVVKHEGVTTLKDLMGDRIQIPQFPSVSTELSYFGSFWGNRNDLAEILELAAAGRIKHQITTVKLDDINDNLQALARGDVVGRQVIVFD